MYSKIFLLSLFVCATLARPQRDPDASDDFNNDLLDRLGPINPNPQYSYSYQVADDDSQNYLAHNEARDGDAVTGEYSYVDANGALVTVVYTAGVNGYQETRTVQEGFITINDNRNDFKPVAKPKPVVTIPKPAPKPVIRPRPTPRPTPAPTPAPSDDDLVAKIIAQLTPFIRDTVSNSLQANQASPAAPAPAPKPVQPAPAPVRPVPVAPAPSPPRQEAASVEGVFGLGGANNVRLETPEFNYAFDL